MNNSKLFWQKVIKISRQALKNGALQPIDTDYEIVLQNGIPFIVKIMTHWTEKEENMRPEDLHEQTFNPFLPYDKRLFIEKINQTHICLLNKYNVLTHHLLIVTSRFEAQDSLLNLSDFKALWACLDKINGLVFYNGGTAAGASQKHKHLQLVPYFMALESKKLPIEYLFKSDQEKDQALTLPHLPFQHRLLFFPEKAFCDPGQTALKTWTAYQRLLQETGVQIKTDGQSTQLDPYNLLLTRKWMAIIPRQREMYQSVISVNALGFAGSFFVKNHEQLSLIKKVKPLTILESVGYPCQI